MTIDRQALGVAAILTLGIMLLLCLWLLCSCSAATVTEYYERTPPRAVSIGEGLTEASGKRVMLNEPFRLDTGEGAKDE